VIENLSAEAALKLMIKDFKGAWNSMTGVKDQQIDRFFERQ